MKFERTKAFAAQLDAADSISHFRNEFLIPERDGKKQIYFLGNSLGLQPKNTQAYIQQVLQQWNDYGVEAFFAGADSWLQYHDSLVNPLAEIVGALPQEVVIMNSLTVNLHLLLVSFYNPEGRRNKILCEAKAFPSDQYLLETHVRQRGFNPDDMIVEVAPRRGEAIIRTEDILAAIEKHKDELSLVFFGGVNYYTGQAFDIKTITDAAHKAGAKAGFDLAHAAGNIALQLHNWGVDFAAWCSYKYLNSGPGAIGGCFIHQRYHKNESLQRFGGWWGYKKETRFLMQQGFVPVESAEGWALSTPPLMLFAAHKAALEIFDKAGIGKLTVKGQLLSDYLIYLLKDVNSYTGNKVQVLTPANAKGSQVSMLIPNEGKKVFNYITSKGVFADWREPDVIRIAPVPLYNTFSEAWLFAQYLREALL